MQVKVLTEGGSLVSRQAERAGGWTVRVVVQESHMSLQYRCHAGPVCLHRSFGTIDLPSLAEEGVGKQWEELQQKATGVFAIETTGQLRWGILKLADPVWVRVVNGTKRNPPILGDRFLF